MQQEPTRVGEKGGSWFITEPQHMKRCPQCASPLTEDQQITLMDRPGGRINCRQCGAIIGIFAAKLTGTLGDEPVIASDADLAAMVSRLRDFLHRLPERERITALCHTEGEATRLQALLRPEERARVQVASRWERP